MTHTPGPWIADHFSEYGFPSRPTPNITINPVVLGQVVNLPIAKIQRNSEEHLANARLIAAAPDLLEALKVLNEFVRQSDAAYRNGIGDTDGVYTQVHSAIAKATGQA